MKSISHHRRASQTSAHKCRPTAPTVGQRQVVWDGPSWESSLIHTENLGHLSIILWKCFSFSEFTASLSRVCVRNQGRSLDAYESLWCLMPGPEPLGRSPKFPCELSLKWTLTMHFRASTAPRSLQNKDFSGGQQECCVLDLGPATISPPCWNRLDEAPQCQSFAVSFSGARALFLPGSNF